MSARADAPQLVYLLPVADEHFLRNTAELLERLREESEMCGRHMLASLLAIAKAEAEDDLKTRANGVRMAARGQEKSDGAAELAKKFACRGGAAGQA